MSRLSQWFVITLLLLGFFGGYFWYRSKAGTTTNAPETTNNTLTTGLASHWTFDREHISGTTITDRAGSNTGTSSGSPTAAIGKFGQALDFDASDDHINVPSATSLDIDATEDFSIAGWFNRDTFASDHTIVAKRNGQADTDDGYIVYIDDATDQLIFEVSDTGDTDELSVASTATFTASGWHHFVAVWDQDSAAGTEVYIDGVTNGTDTGTIANVGDLTEAVAFRIGSESDGGARFDGKLDDIRFYSTTLSASDVYQLSTAGTATVNAPIEDPLSQGLLGYWKMDEGTGTSTTADASGNATTLTMTAIDSGDWQTGQIGPWMLDLDGSAEWLSATDPAVLDFADGASFSITGWFNRDTENTVDTIVAKRNGTANTDDGYMVYIGTDDLLYFEASEISSTDERQVVSTSTFATTGWHQFAISWEDDRDVSLFIDGAPQGTASGSTFANVASLVTALDFKIGAESDNGNPFDGKLDDIRVYGFPLSASDVSKLYQTTAPTQPVDTGLVGHWTFDGPDIQGTTAIDRSSFGNNGTMSGTTKTIGKLGQGIYVDDPSSTGAVYLGNPPKSTMELGTADRTITGWVKFSGSSLGYAYYIFNKGGEGTEGYNCYYDGDSHVISVNVYTESSGGTYFSTSLPASLFNTGWRHIAAVIDRDAGVYLYLDGALLDHVNTSVYNGVDVTNASQEATLATGGYNPIGLDDIRIYNRALSATEIFDLYNLGK